MVDAAALPPPAPAPGPGTRPPSRRRGLFALAAGLVLVAALVAGLVAAFGGTRPARTAGTGVGPAVPPSTDPAQAGSPRAATDAYYGALTRRDARTAYDLLCQTQQQSGYDAYRQLVERDEQSGTGIRGWRSEPGVRRSGDEAYVQGTLRLATGPETPITIGLLQEKGAWRVCGSNLGGILPGPGAGDSGGTTT